MKIVVDQDIPFLDGVLEPFAEVCFSKGSAIDAGLVRDADALLVRTRTWCDRDLLEGSSVQFVGSATIGADHVDLSALQQMGIAFANVPGCNAGGVMQYVFTALYGLVTRGTGVLSPDPDGIWAQGRTFGVIGVGHVGSRVACLAEALGYRVLRCDPPREKAEYGEASACSPFVDLETLLAESDVVTVHVPLDETTRGMIGDVFLAAMKPQAILINSSRGPVAEASALIRARTQGRLGGLVLDVWPGEPDLDEDLLACADVASPHIAGYSYEGKVNGTVGVVRALAAHFGWESLKAFQPVSEQGNLPVWSLCELRKESNQALARRFEQVFDVPAISQRLKTAPAQFEEFRSTFYFRHEFSFDFTEKES